MKKIFSILLVLTMVFALTACGSEETTGTTVTPEPTKVETPAATDTAETATATDDAATETAAEVTEEEAVDTDTTHYLVKLDGDTDNKGDLIDSNEYAVSDGEYAYLFFESMGNATTELAEGAGADGGNAFVITGRSSTWNGASFTIGSDYYGKTLKVSYDCKVDFTVDPEVTSGTVSLTSKFCTSETGEPDPSSDNFQASSHYPGYNRVQGAVTSGEWVHCEGTIYFPDDAFRTDLDGNYNSVIYFELPESCDDIYLDNVVIEVVDESIGTFADMEAKQQEIADANGIVLETEE